MQVNTWKTFAIAMVCITCGAAQAQHYYSGVGQVACQPDTRLHAYSPKSLPCSRSVHPQSG